jgi:hypothetical protein
LHQNLSFVKLKLVCQPNRITNFTNFKSELLYDEVDEAELKLVKLEQSQIGPKLAGLAIN